MADQKAQNVLVDQPITFEMVEKLCSKGATRRTLVLSNGESFEIVVEEVSKRSDFFASMFRDGCFAESKQSDEAVKVTLPYEDTFKPLYTYLMTGMENPSIGSACKRTFFALLSP